jgi:hypothetical protein
MRSSKSLEKNELYDRLLDSIDREMLEHGKRPVKTFEIVSDESQIPKDRGDKIYIISKIPEPDPPTVGLRNNDT